MDQPPHRANNRGGGASPSSYESSLGPERRRPTRLAYATLAGPGRQPGNWRFGAAVFLALALRLGAAHGVELWTLASELNAVVVLPLVLFNLKRLRGRTWPQYAIVLSLTPAPLGFFIERLARFVIGYHMSP